MVKTISGEEHKSIIAQTKVNPAGRIPFPVILAVAALIVAAISFMMGVQYQKGQAGRTVSTAVSQNGNTNSQSGPTGQNGFGGRRRFGGQRPIVGQVTAVDSTSITIKSQDSTTMTFSVTSATTVTDNGQSSSLSNIKIDDTVAIVPTTTDQKQAARILLNPDFNFGNPGAGSTNLSNPSSIN